MLLRFPVFSAEFRRRFFFSFLMNLSFVRGEIDMSLIGLEIDIFNF